MIRDVYVSHKHGGLVDGIRYLAAHSRDISVLRLPINDYTRNDENKGETS